MRKICVEFYVDEDEYDRLDEIAEKLEYDIEDYMKDLINRVLNISEIDEEQ